MIVFALMLTTGALAQVTEDSASELLSFSADTLRPVAWGERLLYAAPARADVDGIWRADLGWSHDPLILLYSDGSEAALLEDVLTLNTAAGLRLGAARLEASVPFVLYASSAVREPAGPILGDPEFGVAVEILERGPLGLAPLARIRLPGGADAWQLGQPGVSWELGLAADVHLGPWTIVGNVGSRGVPETELPTFALNDQIWYRLGGSTARGEWGLGIEAAGHTQYNDPLLNSASPVEVAGSVSWRGLRLASGFGLTAGIGAPVWRVTLGAAQRAVADPT